ncbi:uncharacterized protein B0T15DRAFT_541748, partial [Chaetomium strumarium]
MTTHANADERFPVRQGSSAGTVSIRRRLQISQRPGDGLTDNLEPSVSQISRHELPPSRYPAQRISIVGLAAIRRRDWHDRVGCWMLLGPSILGETITSVLVGLRVRMRCNGPMSSSSSLGCMANSRFRRHEARNGLQQRACRPLTGRHDNSATRGGFALNNWHKPHCKTKVP